MGRSTLLCSWRGGRPLRATCQDLLLRGAGKKRGRNDMTVHYREMHRLQVFSHARTMETHHGRCAAWTVRRPKFLDFSTASREQSQWGPTVALSALLGYVLLESQSGRDDQFHCQPAGSGANAASVRSHGAFGAGGDVSDARDASVNPKGTNEAEKQALLERARRRRSEGERRERALLRKGQIPEHSLPSFLADLDGANAHDPEMFLFEILAHASQLEQRYDMLGLLGTGAFSDVYLAYDRVRDEEVAVKVINTVRTTPDRIAEEIRYMALASGHCNVVALHDVAVDAAGRVCLVMELADGGELFEKLAEGPVEDRADAVNIMRQVLEGVAFLHSRGLAHGDIKPDNILLLQETFPPVPGELGTVAITDMGSTAPVAEGELKDHCGNRGTFAYWSPEIVKKQLYGQPSDMWAVGVILYILLCGVHPFDPTGHTPQLFMVKDIAKGRYSRKEKWYKCLSHLEKDLLSKLLEVDPEKRFTARRALEHEWFKEGHRKLSRSASQRLKGFLHLEFLHRLQTAATGALLAARIRLLAEETGRFPEDTETAPAIKLAYDQAFEAIDTNKNGELDRAEVKEAMKWLGQHMSEEELDVLMEQVDTNGDGVIDKKEFESMMDHLFASVSMVDREILEGIFKTVDTDGDGFALTTELAPLLAMGGARSWSDEVLQALQRKFDPQNKGKISLDEFVAAVEQLFA